MADIHFPCPHCDGNLEVEDEGAGMEIPCPNCSRPITIPNRSASEELRPVSSTAATNFTKTIKLIAIVIAMAIGGILGKAIVETIFENRNRDTVRFDQVLVEISEKANATMPIQVDSETRIDTTTAGPGNRITYYFTLINLKSDEVDPAELIRAKRKEIINGYQTNPSMAELRKRQVELIYQYRDKNGNVVATIGVSPKDF